MKKAGTETKLDSCLPGIGAILSAVLTATAHTINWSHLIVFIALVPWLLTVKKSKTRSEAVTQSFWYYFVGSTLCCYWAIPAAERVFSISTPMAAAVVIPFLLISQTQIAIFAFLSRTNFIEKCFAAIPKPAYVLISAALYTSLDWLIPKLFPVTFGHALFPSSVLRQAADIGGVQLLTFVVVAVNLSFAEAIDSAWKKSNWKTQLILPLTLIFVVVSYGIYRINSTNEPQAETQSFKIAAVQANITYKEKQLSLTDSSVQREIVNKYLEMSQAALNEEPSLDAIVWPETSFPRLYNVGKLEESELNHLLDSFVKQSGKNLIFGAYAVEKEDRFNAAYVLDANGTLQTYYKNVLFPGGEYLPLIGGNNWFTKSIGFKELGRGTSNEPFRLSYSSGVMRAAPMICYESMFTDYLSDSLGKGANFILTLSDDAWFESEVESNFSFKAAAFASVETRTPQIRVNNSGVTAHIDALGNTIKPIHHGESGYRIYSVSAHSGQRSLVMQWGAWFPKLCSLIVILFAAFALYRRTKHQDSL